MAGFSCLLVLTSCGKSPKTFDALSIQPRGKTSMPAKSQVARFGEIEMNRTTFVNTASAADMALLARNRAVFAWADAAAKEQPPIRPIVEPSSVAVSTTQAASAPSPWDWNCVAMAETGGDWSMHGSRYSSALGILNQAIRENASEEVAARILSGTASRDEQIAVGEALVRRFGIGAWARSTVEKCA